MDGGEHGFDAQDAARKLLEIGQSAFTRGTVKDAVAWREKDGTQQFAWIMDPLKMATNLGLGNPEAELRAAPFDYQIKRHFHIDETAFEHERTVGPSEFIWRMANALARAGAEEDAGFTFIPEPGYPWPTRGDEFYSAKRGKMMPSPEPKWLIEIPADPGRDQKKAYGVDLCQLYADKPVTGADIGDAVVGQLGEMNFIVTHAVSPRVRADVTDIRYGTREAWKHAGENIEACGGLLLPSLAIGAIPATNFGLCILIARVGVVLEGLKPYRRRGIYPVHVYNTDAWTGTTGEYVRAGAIAAFNQMHGHSEYMYTWENHVWPLGAPSAEGGGPGDASFVMGTKKMATELKRRMRKWPRNLTPEKVMKVQDEVAMTEARYAYLEAKVDGVMPMNAFPVAVCPKQMKVEFTAFLDAAGWDGELLELEVPDEVYRSATDPEWVIRQLKDVARKDTELHSAIETWAQLQYGWHVADELAKRGPVMNVELA